jgi:peptidoglycan hydrolase-like protein with peptidoglycan-binding domain
MALQSQLFHGDSKLEAAAMSDPAHIVQGATGEHVPKIQLALIQLDGAALKPDGSYGPATTPLQRLSMPMPNSPCSGYGA